MSANTHIYEAISVCDEDIDPYAMTTSRRPDRPQATPTQAAALEPIYAAVTKSHKKAAAQSDSVQTGCDDITVNKACEDRLSSQDNLGQGQVYDVPCDVIYSQPNQHKIFQGQVYDVPCDVIYSMPSQHKSFHFIHKENPYDSIPSCEEPLDAGSEGRVKLDAHKGPKLPPLRTISVDKNGGETSQTWEQVGLTYCFI